MAVTIENTAPCRKKLRIEVEVLALRSTAGKMKGIAYVDGKLACEAVLSCAIVDRPGAANGNAAEAK